MDFSIAGCLSCCCCAGGALLVFAFVLGAFRPSRAMRDLIPPDEDDRPTPRPEPRVA